VWVLFGTGDLACVSAEGRIVWQRNLVKEFGPLKTNHGYGSSPMLDGNRLFVVRMHQGADSYVLAVDAKTGKDLWKKDRSNAAREEGKDSYSTPIFHRHGGKLEVVVAGAEVLNAYNPSNGDVVWSVSGLDVPHPYGRTIAGPTAGEGVVVAVASGFQNRGYTVGIKAGGHGDITTTHSLWKSTRYSADCPTPVIVGGHLFSIRDDGMASCLNLKTGEALWQERLFTENVKVSPVVAAGRVYFTSGRGNTVVAAASPRSSAGCSSASDKTGRCCASLTCHRLPARPPSIFRSVRVRCPTDAPCRASKDCPPAIALRKLPACSAAWKLPRPRANMPASCWHPETISIPD
jgi:outer membrane protein assembly factor BamB